MDRAWRPHECGIDRQALIVSDDSHRLLRYIDVLRNVQAALSFLAHPLGDAARMR